MSDNIGRRNGLRMPNMVSNANINKESKEDK